MRLARLQKVNRSRELQALTLAVSSQDIVSWMLDWCFTFDPREEISDRPFDLFPRQEEFLRWIRARETAKEDGLAEKCRDVGFTWLCAGYALHGWLFRKGFSAGIGSRKVTLVDQKGNPDCIFEKFRYLLARLPAWMLPVGFNWKKHDNSLKLSNPENGSSITGEGGDEIGRGGRKSIYFVDEAAFLERASKVVAALSQTSKCKIWVSTPNGTGNEFYRMRFGGKIEVFTFHWQDDPRKDEAWLERQKEILPPAVVAQEILIDYTASLEGILIESKWVQSAIGFAQWLKSERGIELPNAGDLLAGLDIAEGGNDRSVMMPRRGCIVDPRILSGDLDWAKLTTTQTAFKSRDLAIKLGIKHLLYDVGGGYGATVRGMMDSADVTAQTESESELAKLFTDLPFTATGVNGGSSPDPKTKWPDGRTSQETFYNLRAEIWWKMRLCFERTYEFREGIKEHPLTSLISIPLHTQLIAELSTPLHYTTETGLIIVESKKMMARRGVKSPDFADALAYTYAPVKVKRKINIW